MKNLTEGNEAKIILQFAVPMLIGNVFQQFYNTVDSIVVGRGVGAHALAAVGASFPIIFLMVSLLLGITMGSSIMLAQYFGAGDHDRVRRTMSTTYIFLFFSSIAISVLGVVFSEPMLRAIKTPEEILPLGTQYLQLLFAGMIFLFGYNTVSAILRGLGDSKTPLYFLIIATILNTVLDLLFVLGFGWGIAGAAWATVIAQGVAMIISFVYIQRSQHEVLHISWAALEFDVEMFRTMLKIGLPTAVQLTLVSLGFVALTRIVNPFGTLVIAGYAAAIRLDSFAAMPAMNLSMALSTFVGQNLGAGKPERVKRGYIATLAAASSISLTMTLVMVSFPDTLIRIFNSDPEVIRIGAEYLIIVSSFYLVFSGMFVTAGVLRGAGDTLVQMFITLAALWIIRIPVSALLSGYIGTKGIWWGIPAGWLVGFLFSFVYYLSGRWKRKVLVRSKPHS
jgi:putative MATE family efflux protein